MLLEGFAQAHVGQEAQGLEYHRLIPSVDEGRLAESATRPGDGSRLAESATRELEESRLAESTTPLSGETRLVESATPYSVESSWPLALWIAARAALWSLPVATERRRSSAKGAG